MADLIGWWFLIHELNISFKFSLSLAGISLKIRANSASQNKTFGQTLLLARLRSKI